MSFNEKKGSNKKKSNSKDKGKFSSSKNQNKNQNKKKQQPYRQQRKSDEVIVFDPEARQEYLRGFSDRKRQRRAFGLAMQKVKDRKAKLEQRAQHKQAVMEQMEQAEQQKEALLQVILEEEKVIGELVGEKSIQKSGGKKAEEEDVVLDKVEMYQDKETQSHWGGEVIVTTSTHIPGDSSDSDEDDDDDDNDAKLSQKKQKQTNTDVAQEYAGNVERFMQELKGNMPSKRKNKDQSRRNTKGKHGAANMKGMATGGDLKLAQKVLQRTMAKQKGGKGSNKRKR